MVSTDAHEQGRRGEEVSAVGAALLAGTRRKTRRRRGGVRRPISSAWRHETERKERANGGGDAGFIWRQRREQIPQTTRRILERRSRRDFRSEVEDDRLTSPLTSAGIFFF